MGFALNFPETEEEEESSPAIGYNSVLLPTPPICYLTAVPMVERRKNT
jgi:hypothetical protein